MLETKIFYDNTIDDNFSAYKWEDKASIRIFIMEKIKGHEGNGNDKVEFKEFQDKSIYIRHNGTHHSINKGDYFNFTSFGSIHVFNPKKCTWIGEKTKKQIKLSYDELQIKFHIAIKAMEETFEILTKGMECNKDRDCKDYIKVGLMINTLGNAIKTAKGK